MISSGSLRHRITIQKPKSGQESFGKLDTDSAFDDFCTVWASVEPLTGRMFFEAEKNNSEITHKVIMRYRKDLDIKPGMRIIFNKRKFEIMYAMNLKELNIELNLMCKEVI